MNRQAGVIKITRYLLQLMRYSEKEEKECSIQERFAYKAEDESQVLFFSKRGICRIKHVGANQHVSSFLEQAHIRDAAKSHSRPELLFTYGNYSTNWL